MADNQGVVAHESDMDYPEHERTYRLFLKLVKWVVIDVAVIMILMAIFLL